MNIGILLAGHTNEKMSAQHDDYGHLFKKLFASSHLYENFKFSVLPVVDGVFPESINQFDGFLITGSAYGVYDDAPFIKELLTLVKNIYLKKKALAGICFGHQIIAEALGGHAKKWPGGWTIGNMNLNFFNQPDSFRNQMETATLIHVHQDQVVSLPPGAKLIASTKFCKNAGFVIDNQVLALQGHPEFKADYAAALFRILETQVGSQIVEKAIQSLVKSNDGIEFGHDILSFFETYHKCKNHKVTLESKNA